MDTSHQKTVIVVTGPTASGKTAVAIDIARRYQTEIISADSRQCFRELNIGVARPSQEELAAVSHHFIASHSIQEEVTAASFEEFALRTARELFIRHDVIVMVGGTGLYIKAFCEGLDSIPAIPQEIRDKIISQYQALGMDWLSKEVRQKDPEFFRLGENQNPQRMMRALEVKEATGQSVLEYRSGKKVTREFAIREIGLDIPKEVLHQRINTRVDNMMEQGLLEEVKGLLRFKNLNALQTVGYKELFDHLEGKSTLERAVELIKQNTRQYAKRQLTWFRKDKEIKWMSPEEGGDFEF